MYQTAQAGKKTDGRKDTAGEGTSATAPGRDRGSTNTAPPAGSSHSTNMSTTSVRYDGESYDHSSDEDNPDVAAFEQQVKRYQSRGEPNGPAKGRQNRRQPQNLPPSNMQNALSSTQFSTFTHVPQQQPPPPQGLAMQGNHIPAMTVYGGQTMAPAGRGNRVPATTAYGQTTAPAGRGNRRPPY